MAGEAANSRRRTLALVTLVLQNTALVICMRISRTADGPIYYSSTAVASMEVLKLMVCLAIVIQERGVGGLMRTVLGKPLELLRLSVPSLLYTIQNNLLYYALSNLDAAIYQVSYQIKILTTALFSVFMLQRYISNQKWFALLVLTLGVAMVQLSDKEKHSAATGEAPVMGFAAVLAASATSGFSGVYFERVLRRSSETLWARNVQMGVTSVTLAILSVYTKDREGVLRDGFFFGYTGIVWAVVFFQALGGLVVAFVTKYANTILKCFATAISIVCISVISVFLFNTQISLLFAAGAILVMLSIFLYNESMTELLAFFSRPRAARLAELEDSKV